MNLRVPHEALHVVLRAPDPEGREFVPGVRNARIISILFSERARTSRSKLGAVQEESRSYTISRCQMPSGGALEEATNGPR